MAYSMQTKNKDDNNFFADNSKSKEFEYKQRLGKESIDKNRNQRTNLSDLSVVCPNFDLSGIWNESQFVRDVEHAVASTTNCSTITTSQNSEMSSSSQYMPSNNCAMFNQSKIRKIEPNELDRDEEMFLGITMVSDLSQYRNEMATTFDNLETSMSVNVNTNINDIDWFHENISVQSDLLDVTHNRSEFDIASVAAKALLANAQNGSNILQTAVEEVVVKRDPILGPFYGLPLKVKALIRKFKGINELYDWQDECLKLDAINNKKNLVYMLPTSGGKSLVSEILILREILCHRKNALLVLPYVSIVQEKMWAFSPFAIELNFLLEEYAAGKGTYPLRKRRHKKTVYIATIEKAHGIINTLIETNRLGELGLVVVDELHLIGEGSRGATLEMLLTKIMYSGIKIQIIGMSATIGNLPEICKFLNAEYFTKNFRPVELLEHIKCGDTVALVKDNKIEPVRKINSMNYSQEQQSIDPDKIGCLVMEVIPEGSCLIFCPTKKNCENVAVLLTRVLKRNLMIYKKFEKKRLLVQLQTDGAICNVLKQTIPFGIAYHHSGLTTDERRTIEDGFRCGILCVICCTSTLAAGVNLPAKRVILRSPYIGKEFINLSRYKQMVGRAGRAGFAETGESYLLFESRDFPKVKDILTAPMDEAISNLSKEDSKGLNNLVLSSIVLGLATTRYKLQQIMKQTLLGVQEQRLETSVKNLTDRSISQLFKSGALKIDNNISVPENISVKFESSTNDENDLLTTNEKVELKIKNNTILAISKLGKAAIKGGMDLDKAHMLYEDLVEAQSGLILKDCLHLLYLVTPYELVTQIKPQPLKYYNLYMQLGKNELQTAKRLGINEACAINFRLGKPVKNVPEKVLNRFYLTLMLNSLWNGTSVHDVAQKFEISRGIVQQLMLSAATFAICVVHFCEELDEFWPFANILKGMSLRLQHCSSHELLPLMELPSVKLSRAKLLYDAGYKSLQSVAKANPYDLVNNIKYMTNKVAVQLVAAANVLLLEKIENLREEAEDVLEGNI